MDCSCCLKQICLSVAISSKNSFYLLTSDHLIEVDTYTQHVVKRIPATKSFEPEKSYTLQASNSDLYVFSTSPEYQIYSTDPPEFLKAVLCSGKKPYIPHSVIVSSDYIIFSTLSHANVYLCSLSTLNTLGVVKKPIKLRLPSKVVVNMLVMHPEKSILMAACTDGVVRVWDIESKEELCLIFNTGEEKRTKKNVLRLAKKYGAAVNCVGFNRNGEEVIVGDDKGMAVVWDCAEIADCKVLASSRISEQGVIDVACFVTNTGQQRYIALIKEAKLVYLELISGKIKAISIYTLTVPEEIRLSKSLYVLDSGYILLLWPGSLVKTLNLLYLSNPNMSFLTKHLPYQPHSTLIPSPVIYPEFFYYKSQNSLYSYSILNGSSAVIIPNCNCVSFDIRPCDKPTQALLVNEHEVVYVDIESGVKVGIDGCSAVFIGKDSEVAKKVVALSNDRASVNIFEIATHKSQVFQLALKIKTLFKSTVDYGITYETLHEHSIRLSKGFFTQELTDVLLDAAYRLEYDELLISIDWHINGESLAVATSKRICILSNSLIIQKSFNLSDPPLSLYWFGSTLFLSKRDGVYYCGDSLKTLFHTIQESVLCGVLNDRVFLYYEGQIKAYPHCMLEALLYGCLESAEDTQKIDHLVTLMPTACVSEDIIIKLLESNLPRAALFLAEKSIVSLEVRIEILKALNRFEDIEKLLLRNKNISDSLSYHHLFEELHSDHNWKLERTLLPKVSQFFDSCGQLQRESKMLKLNKNFWQLSLLHLSVGNAYPLTELPSLNEPELEDRFIEEIASLGELKLGYGEVAYQQKVGKEDILIAYTENISQWFGWDALKPPEKIVPKFMENIRENAVNENLDEDVELSESDAIYLYLRCDEGKGVSLVDIVMNKVVKVCEEQWAGILNEGDPLDYDDKWGKQAQPSFKVMVSEESGVDIEEIAIGKVWSFEFWAFFNENSCRVAKVGDLVISLSERKLIVGYETTEVQVKSEEGNRDIKVCSWEHICIAVKHTKLNVFLSGTLALIGNLNKAAEIHTIALGGFSGFVTEIRLWKTFRSSELIKENLKCPLEILSEKRKKKWVNIKINKSEKKAEDMVIASPRRLAMPDKPKFELRPPGGFPKKLAPPSLIKFPAKVKDKNQLEELFSLFTNKEYQQALEALEKINDSSKVETLEIYKTTVKMLLRIEKYKKSSRDRKQLKAAAMLNLLCQANVEKEHKKAIGIQAAEQNVKVLNFGIAAKLIYSLLDQSNDAETEVLERLLQDCIENESQDKSQGYEDALIEAQKYF